MEGRKQNMEYFLKRLFSPISPVLKKTLIDLNIHD